MSQTVDTSTSHVTNNYIITTITESIISAQDRVTKTTTNALDTALSTLNIAATTLQTNTTGAQILLVIVKLRWLTKLLCSDILVS